MGAVRELWFVIIMFGGPALAAVLWEQHKKRKARKNEWRVLTDWEAMGRVIQLGVNEGYEDAVKKKRQALRDDHIFKTVEEYRNDTA